MKRLALVPTPALLHRAERLADLNDRIMGHNNAVGAYVEHAVRRLQQRQSAAFLGDPRLQHFISALWERMQDIDLELGSRRVDAMHEELYGAAA